MARKLTEPMKEALRIMREGYEIELFCGYYLHLGTHNIDVHAATVKAFRTRLLIEPIGQGTRPSWIKERYVLTETGRRAAAELG